MRFEVWQFGVPKKRPIVPFDRLAVLQIVENAADDRHHAAGKAWHRVVNGTRSITADTALRLSAYFGTTPEFWMTLQAEYDLRRVRRTSWPEIEPRIRTLGNKV